MITTEITLASEKKLEVVKAFSTSPIKCIENLWGKVSSVRQALEPDCPIQLSELNRTSPNQIRAAIIKLIERSLVYAGFEPKTMNNDQLVMVVNDIIESYPHYRLEDVIMVFKKGRREESYPQFYGRIDCRVFLSWFKAYDKERCSVIESLPSNHLKPADLTQGIPWEQYREDLMKKVEEGDEEAKKQLEAMESVRRRFEADRGQLFNYRYNQKHKFDDK
jgi:hypothetical protein